MRSIWTGSVSFGLINIPIKMFSAVQESSLDMDMLDKSDHSNIKFKRVNENTGKEVEFGNIVKGYKLDDKYIILEDIYPILEKLNTNKQLEIIGKSALDIPIYKFQIGTGKIKILLWSQMHGDESSTTKASFDCFNFFEGNSNEAELFLKKFKTN